MMSLKIEWYYDRAHDAVVVASTTMTYMLLYVGRINNVANVSPTIAPADLLQFLRPPLAFPKYELMLEVKPIQSQSHYPSTFPCRNYSLYLLITTLGTHYSKGIDYRDKFIGFSCPSSEAFLGIRLI